MNASTLPAGFLLATLALAAHAAPKVSPLGDGEFRGITNYSVECDSGKKSIIQCRKDQQHCGYSHDRDISVVAEQRCSGAAAAAAATAPIAESPQPDDEDPASSIQSRPARP